MTYFNHIAYIKIREFNLKSILNSEEAEDILSIILLHRLPCVGFSTHKTLAQNESRGFAQPTSHVWYANNIINSLIYQNDRKYIMHKDLVN